MNSLLYFVGAVVIIAVVGRSLLGRSATAPISRRDRT
jgi:hypothetical protein